jgi:hypothetical protein
MHTANTWRRHGKTLPSSPNQRGTRLRLSDYFAIAALGRSQETSRLVAVWNFPLFGTERF